MVKFSHFKVEVLQDGAAAREYADPAAGESLDTETKYIEIQERKKLVIRLTVHEHFQFEEYDALCVEVRVDGEYAGGICYHQFSLVEDSENVKLIEGIPYTSDGKTCLRTFRFEEAEMSRKV